jgi:hypothetical protein
MKLTFFGFVIAATSIFVTACDGPGQARDNKSAAASEQSRSTADDSKESNEPDSSATTKNLSIKEIVQHYMHVKNALADDNSAEAANGAKAIMASIDKTDQAAFTEEQKKVYADVKDDLKEQAEHTSQNATNIHHQREHFIAMSEDVYDLVKAFGTSQTLYQDHCPMANDNKGANWLSENEEISNPYMGKKMPGCGKVEEIIKQ